MENIFLLEKIEKNDGVNISFHIRFISEKYRFSDVREYIGSVIIMDEGTNEYFELNRVILTEDKLLLIIVFDELKDFFQNRNQKNWVLKILLKFHDNSIAFSNVIYNTTMSPVIRIEELSQKQYVLFSGERTSRNINFIVFGDFILVSDQNLDELVTYDLNQIKDEDGQIIIEIIPSLHCESILQTHEVSLRNRRNHSSEQNISMVISEGIITSKFDPSIIFYALGIWDFVVKATFCGIVIERKIINANTFFHPKTFLDDVYGFINLRPYITQNNELSILVHKELFNSHIETVLIGEGNISINGSFQIFDFDKKYRIQKVALTDESNIQSVLQISGQEIIDNKINYQLDIDLSDNSIRNLAIGTYAVLMYLEIERKIVKVKLASNLSDIKDKSKSIIYPGARIYNSSFPLQFTPFYNRRNEFQLSVENIAPLYLQKFKVSSERVMIELTLKNTDYYNGTNILDVYLMLRDVNATSEIIIKTNFKTTGKNIILSITKREFKIAKNNKYKAFLRFVKNDNNSLEVPLNYETSYSEIKYLKIKKNLVKIRNGLYLKFSTSENNNLLIETRDLLGKAYKFSSVLKFRLAKILGAIIQKFLKKEIWLVGENLGEVAQDNGISFFEYCMNNKVNEKVYFVAKRTNQDIKKLGDFSDNILVYDSFKHQLFHSLSKYLIVSHGIRDVLPTVLHNKIRENNKDVIYLQHGIVAMKKLGFNGKSYNGKIKKFVVSSEHEREIFVNEMNFNRNQIIVTGLSRFDKLQNKKTKKQLLIIPTWRTNIINSENDFINSRFFKAYSSLLGSEGFHDVLAEYDIEVNFYPHIEVQKKYIDYFNGIVNPNINIIRTSEKTVQELICESSIMITDYSSVAFDFNYLRKPVLFYQFDLDDYLEDRGAYINLKTDLFGDVFYDEENLIKSLRDYAKNDFRYKEEFIKKSNKYYKFQDKKNSERIYQEIKHGKE
ncbi:hypothetical protein HFN20_24040 [Paenibacillus dendritiformis]|uniref:CDP-glycerol glycerophosphotransferase family protein n=3 Tax=Paenibacillus dendritiformis TaxID=130049 RepID=UPI00143DBBC8|nr:CDP-glycerol glycerophosphotransferase family protein [Paenibacillus dendritiformis]NKI24244.1 hypothetical protein [Paenibacillus dendritiformis]